jgi:ABC-type antimicrobial peptide transport system permease subunit
MWRKAIGWKVSFWANFLGLILGLSLVELIFLQFNSARQTTETPWLPPLILAITVLILVTINYANFTAMQLKTRTGESGLRKLFGATAGQIAVQLLLESLIIVAIAVLLSMVLTEVMSPLFNRLYNSNCSLRKQGALLQLALAGALILLVGLAGAVYPIWRFANITMKDVARYLTNVR